MTGTATTTTTSNVVAIVTPTPTTTTPTNTSIIAIVPRSNARATARRLDPFPRRRAPSSNNATLYTTTTNRAPIVPITTTINTTTTTSLPLYLIVILRTATEPYPKSARVHPPNRAGPQRPSIAFHRSRAPRGSRTRGRGPGSKVNRER